MSGVLRVVSRGVVVAIAVAIALAFTLGLSMRTQREVIAAWGPAENQRRATTPAARGPLTFVENVGQFSEGARFQIVGANGSIWLADDGLWVTVFDESSTPGTEVATDSSSPPSKNGTEPPSVARRGVNLKLSFADANAAARIEPFGRLDTNVSFFIGNDPSNWHPDVPTWTGVRYHDLYPGVDLKIIGADGRWEWRLASRSGEVSQGTLAKIRLRIEGATAVSEDAGVLRIRTAVGEVGLPLLESDELHDSKPVIASLSDGSFAVSAPFVESETFAAATELQPLGASTLGYGTFLGGTSGERGSAIAVDASGNAYVVGYTFSSNFPTTPGAFDTSYNSDTSYWDVFVTKLNPMGTAPVYSTYLGGQWNDSGTGIAVDASGSAYITGLAGSPDFPTTTGAFDTTYNGEADVFVTKLNPAGSTLVFSTFLGGTMNESGSGIAVDTSNNVYLSGDTSSTNFPTTPSAFATTDSDVDHSDAFVVKLSADGSVLLHGTYLGGSESDWAYGIAVDAWGTAYVTGQTYSADFATTAGAFDTTYNGDANHFDAFVVKLTPSTYFVPAAKVYLPAVYR